MVGRETQCWLSPLPCWCPSVARVVGIDIWNNPAQPSPAASACRRVHVCRTGSVAVLGRGSLHHSRPAPSCSPFLCPLPSFLHVLCLPVTAPIAPFHPCCLCVRSHPPCGHPLPSPLPPYLLSTACPLFPGKLQAAVAQSFILWTRVSESVP